MDREKVIDKIQWLYPPDTNEAGKELLIRALCRAWRSLPDDVLSELLNLCMAEDTLQYMERK